MAGTSLLALIDDVATILDDVAILAKIAAKKTTGVLGDDLALNAQQIAGIQAQRELPVVWAVAKGSARNKVILVPLALIISRFTPWLVTPLLMLGGTYLCFEGLEKVAHHFLHSRDEKEARHAELASVNANPGIDLVAYEKAKIRGAVRTDFVLSAEIVTISLGIVAAAPFLTQIIVLSGIAALMTAGVYGVVAFIVKLDDMGLHLHQKAGSHGMARFQRAMGSGILASASRLMKGLAMVGTAAMFLVGGGIIGHGIPTFHHLRAFLTEMAGKAPGLGGILVLAAPLIFDAAVGMLTGAAALGIVTLVQWIARNMKATPNSKA